MTSFDHHLLLLRAQPFASTGGFWLNAPEKGARGTYGIHVGPLCELCGSTGRRFIVLNLQWVEEWSSAVSTGALKGQTLLFNSGPPPCFLT